MKEDEQGMQAKLPYQQADQREASGKTGKTHSDESQSEKSEEGEKVRISRDRGQHKACAATPGMRNDRRRV